MYPVDWMIFRFKFFVPFGETSFGTEHTTENDVRWTLVSKSKNKMKKNKWFQWWWWWWQWKFLSIKVLVTFSSVKNGIRWIWIYHIHCYRNDKSDHVEQFDKSSMAVHLRPNWHRLFHRMYDSHINLVNSIRPNYLDHFPIEFFQFDLELSFFYSRPAGISLTNPHWMLEKIKKIQK